MKRIDLSNWSRASHFAFFRSLAQPHFVVCAELEARAFKTYAKAEGVSLFLALAWAATTAANAVPELRTRFRGARGSEEIVEHAVLHPSVTVPLPGGLFNFCILDFERDFSSFADISTPRLRAAEQAGGLHDASEGRDDMIFLTSLPWLRFTSLTFCTGGPDDCIPRVAWGRLTEAGGGLVLPVAVHAHHALADGLHLSRFLDALQAVLDAPAAHLGGRTG